MAGVAACRPAVKGSAPMWRRSRPVARWIVILMAGLVGAGSALAQFRAVPGQEYQEVVNPKHAVSGHAVVGVSFVGGSPGRRLHVLLPAGAAGSAATLRVELDSPDGRFHGSGLFDGAGPPGTWVAIDLLPEGKESRRPADLAESDLAVLVRSMAGGAPRPLLASWGMPDPRDATVRLHVNSRRAKISVQRAGGGGSLPCRRVQSASTVRFDTVCDIPVAALGPAVQGRYRVNLIRSDGFDNEPIVYDLWW